MIIGLDYKIKLPNFATLMSKSRCRRSVARGVERSRCLWHMTWHSKVQLGLFLGPLSYCPVITFLLPLPRLSLSPYPPAHDPQTKAYPKSVIRLGRPPTKWVMWTLLPSSLSSFRRHRHRSANLPLPPQMACQLEITAHKFCCSLRR